MGVADYLQKGGWNVICDRCGFKYKASMCRKDGYNPSLFVCKGCWDPKQEQESIRGIPDKQYVPIARPDSAPVYVTGDNVPPTITTDDGAGDDITWGNGPDLNPGSLVN